ncbi:NAD(P)-binding protein [Atractiella rhizophila]|nr:NAD(P)-binding protein [Atractiella rhizophila]
MASRSSQPLKVGVLGFGMSATIFHIPLIQSLPQLYTLHSVQSRSAGSPTADSPLAKFHKNFPDVKLVTTYEEVASDPDIDVVCVCTPNDSHEAVVKLLLENGKHVILEKPSFITSDAAQRSFDLAKEKQRLIAVYQNRRFDADFLTLRKLIEKKVFGPLNELSTYYDRYRPSLSSTAWKNSAAPGHGIVFDLGTHLLDQILHLFGLPAEVSTPVLRNVKEDGGAPDEMLVLLGYGKLNVLVRGTVLSPLKKQLRFVAKGKNASWVKYGIDAQEDQLKHWMSTRGLGVGGGLDEETFGFESEDLTGTLTIVKEDGSFTEEQPKTERGNYQAWYLQNHAAFVSNDASKLVVSDLDAINLIRLIELIYESASKGGAKLPVPSSWGTA